MAFVSFSFLVFLLVLTIIYFLVPSRCQWIVLLAGSYFFIIVNSGILVWILFATTMITYFFGRLLEKLRLSGKKYLKEQTEGWSRERKKAYREKNKKVQRVFLATAILIDLGFLFFFKYYNFFALNTNGALHPLGVQLPVLQLLPPLGISFYTLQEISYLTDIYRGKMKADQNPAKFMLFMSFFPQIVQGPIPRYHQLAHQLYEEHSFEEKRLVSGAQLILWGFKKKLILADRIAMPVNTIFDHSYDYHGMILLLGAAFYGIQVYADFSGGMDIARGVSQIFGITLELNFRQPYHSTSVEDFWRRWHISLGKWMRDYVFYPLSISKAFSTFGKRSRKILGNYVGKRLPSFLAMFVSFFLVGIWHGPNWKYLAYGIWNGIFIVFGILLEEIYKKSCGWFRIRTTSVSWKLFQYTRTFLLIAMGRFFSRANGFLAACEMMRRTLFRFWDFTFLLDGSLRELGLDTANWILPFISIGILFFVDHLHEKEIHIRETIARQHLLFRWLLYGLAILSVVIFGIYGPEYTSAGFLYEQI